MERPDAFTFDPIPDWLSDPAAQRVCRTLTEAGHDVYFVGGCVRNAVLGLDVADVDLSTSALPEETLSLAEKAGLRAIPTGLEHGTITIVVGDQPFEVTTFRKDVETDGRRAVVAFSKSIEDDARRRDFTMNALYADRSGQLVDPLNGLADAKARKVRFIDDAGARIREDYLRILRFFRFSAYYAPDEAFDADTLASIAEHIEGLGRLSHERIGQEIRKLLAAENPAPALGTMEKVGVLHAILPGAVTDFVAPLVEVEQALSLAPDPIRRLAALGSDEAREHLRLSRADDKLLKSLRQGMGSAETGQTLGYLHGDEAGASVLALRSAMLSQLPDKRELAKISTGSAARFPVSATDLSERFEGRALGEELRRLEALWLASDMRMTKADLLG